MAVSVDWAAKVINIPRADLTLIQSSPTEIRQLDLNTFRLELRALEASTDGAAFDHTHNHNQPVTVGGVTLARVVEIVNNYTVTFEDGQYAVNLVGANSNVGDRVNVNQVSVRSANSAGLVQSNEIELASFNNEVYIDVDNGFAGTLYPTGTIRRPVNNMDDAMLIAQVRGLKAFNVRGTLVVLSGDYSRFDFRGDPRTSIIVNFGGIFSNCQFRDIILTGDFSSSVGFGITRGSVIDATISDPFLTECGIIGTLTIVPGDAGGVWTFNCLDTDPSENAPTIDLATYSGLLFMRNYTGSLRFINSNADCTVHLDFQGKIILDSSCTGGNFVLRGIGKAIDNSTGTTVDTSDLVTNESVANRVHSDTRALTVGKFLGLKE